LNSGFDQEAMMKDSLERASSPNFNFRSYLEKAYVHPVFKGDGNDDDYEQYLSENQEADAENVLVPTRRHSRRNSPAVSRAASPALSEEVQSVEHRV
jgi:lysine-specific demethylase 3